MKSASGKYILLCLMAAILILAGSCSEDTEAGGSSLLIPDGDLGTLPQSMTFSQPLEYGSMDSDPVSRGLQERVFAGNRDQFKLHGLLSFVLSLPSDATVVSATLRLYIVSFENQHSDIPLEMDILMLDRDFEEEEVTWEQAAEGDPWTTPGGDFALNEPLGSFEFTGEAFDSVAIDTALIVLDVDQINDLIEAGKKYMPVALVPGEQDCWFSCIAGEMAESYAVASLLDMTYTVEGSSTNSSYEVRAKSDATVTGFSGSLDASMLTVGDTPASQTFLKYDLSQLPASATINKAILHVSVFDAAYVDTFQVLVFAVDEKEYTPMESLSVSVSQGVGLDTDSLAVDITMGLQIVLGRDSTGTSSFVGLGSNTDVNVGGYVQFYPPDWSDESLRPVLELIYTDAPDNAKP